jgi:hypothetical protein
VLAEASFCIMKLCIFSSSLICLKNGFRIYRTSPMVYPEIFWGVGGVGGGFSPGIFSGEGGSTKSVEDGGQRERRSGGGSPLVRGSTQFANE